MVSPKGEGASKVQRSTPRQSPDSPGNLSPAFPLTTFGGGSAWLRSSTPSAPTTSNLRRVSANGLAISLDETTSRNDVAALFKLIAQTTLDIEAIDAREAQESTGEAVADGEFDASAI